MRLIASLLFFGIFCWIGWLYVDLAHDPLGLKKTKIKIDLSNCFLYSFLVGILIGILGICILVMIL